MLLKHLSNSGLLISLKNLVKQERELLSEILQHLIVVEDRRLYLEEGYGSLFEYATKILNYNESQAYRRIAAMRVLRELPELKEPIESGRLNLTHLTQAKQFFQTKSKNSEPLSKTEKVSLISSLENKSSRETEKVFAELMPEAKPAGKTRIIANHLSLLQFSVGDALMQKLHRFKELDSHFNPSPTYSELLERLVDLATSVKEKQLGHSRVPHTKSRPLKRFATAIDSSTLNEIADNAVTEQNGSAINFKTTNLTSLKFSAPKKNFTTSHSRAIPVYVKRIVMARDEGACVFVNSNTQKRCGSKFKIQFDHRLPFAKGGPHSVENLRLYCASHNLLAAEKSFGRSNRNHFRNSFNQK